MNKADITKKLPTAPGVYFFKDAREKVLYVGKATSLRDRVQSYFSADITKTRGPLIQKMLSLFSHVDFIKTDSVLEAIILEANLIKKFDPQYNSKEKDNKSFNYVIFTKDDFPQVRVMRGRTLATAFPKENIKYVFGPFPHGTVLKEAINIVRKIFPFTDKKCVPASVQIKKGPPKPCFNRQIGLCPGVCTGEVTKKDYAKMVNHLKLFFEAKKPALLQTLQKEMKSLAKTREFEKAGEIKKTIFALGHIQDIALLKNTKDRDFLRSTINGTILPDQKSFRIEAYDVSHLHGSNMVGVMVAIVDGQAEKSEYRKFKIKFNTGINDISALKEILRRRLGHAEWTLPNLVVVDGAQAQSNAAKEILKELGFAIDVVSVVKDAQHKARAIIGEKSLVLKHRRDILLANAESHRFAIKYHRAVRQNNIF